MFWKFPRKFWKFPKMFSQLLRKFWKLLWKFWHLLRNSNNLPWRSGNISGKSDYFAGSSDNPPGISGIFLRSFIKFSWISINNGRRTVNFRRIFRNFPSNSCNSLEVLVTFLKVWSICHKVLATPQQVLTTSQDSGSFPGSSDNLLRILWNILGNCGIFQELW